MKNELLKILLDLNIQKNSLSWMFMEKSKQIDINDYIKNKKDKIPNVPGIYVIRTNTNIVFVSFCGTTLREKIGRQGKMRKKIELFNSDDDYDLSIHYNTFEPDSVIGKVFSYHAEKETRNYHEQVLISDFKPFMIPNDIVRVNILNIYEERFYREVLLEKNNPEDFSIFLLKEILISDALIEKRFYEKDKLFQKNRVDKSFVDDSNRVIFEYLKNNGFYDKKSKL
jgi:hypothetical protein